MPYVRATIVISACYHVTNTDKPVEVVCVEQEADIRTDLQEKTRRLLAFAKAPGGTISWKVVPEKEPVAGAPEIPTPTPPTKPAPASPPRPEREIDPRVKAELLAISQGRDPKGGNI